MTKKKNEGKLFEEDFRKSCEEQNTFFYRIKDVSPMMLKPNVRLSKNDYDSFIYKKPNLFPVELKSTKAKSISFSESMIKSHQIKALTEASKYDGLISGFIFNFREPENRVFFIHIEDFNTYKNIAENDLEHTYEGRINKSSIPIHICEQIGIEVKSIKKVSRYRYMVKQLLDELIARFN